MKLPNYLFMLCLLLVSAVQAQSLTTLQLQHRTAAEVIPVIEVDARYSGDLFSATRVETLLRRFAALVERVVADADEQRPVADLLFRLGGKSIRNREAWSDASGMVGDRNRLHPRSRVPVELARLAPTAWNEAIAGSQAAVPPASRMAGSRVRQSRHFQRSAPGAGLGQLRL